MKRIVKFSLFTALVISTIIVLVYCARNLLGSTRAKAPSESRITPPNIVSLEEFSFTEYADNGATKKFTIEGKKLSEAGREFGVFKLGPAKVMKLKNIIVTFYEGGMPVSRLYAKKGILEPMRDKRDLRKSLTSAIDFSGYISVITEEKRTLTCDELRWDNIQNRIFARGNCILRYEGKMARADLMDTDPGLKNFKCSKDRKKNIRIFKKILS
jgi:hypothetical protein